MGLYLSQTNIELISNSQFYQPTYLCKICKCLVQYIQSTLYYVYVDNFHTKELFRFVAASKTIRKQENMNERTYCIFILNVSIITCTYS